MSYETRFRCISFQFRARRSKNYEAYTEYLLNNFCKDVAEIEKKDADLEFRNSKCFRVNLLERNCLRVLLCRRSLSYNPRFLL
ncbi:MAG: hypothetical protein Q8P86_02515 [bacterium]|nr:hypothetical protein [bacterium]